MRGVPGARSEGAGAQPGVRDASVNLMMASASVIFDPSVIAPSQLVQAIRDTGYEAELPAAIVDVVAEQGVREQTQSREYRTYAPQGHRQRTGRRFRDGRLDAADDRHGTRPRGQCRPLHAAGSWRG